jgi:hypothetical protein
MQDEHQPLRTIHHMEQINGNWLQCVCPSELCFLVLAAVEFVG